MPADEKQTAKSQREAPTHGDSAVLSPDQEDYLAIFGAALQLWEILHQRQMRVLKQTLQELLQPLLANSGAVTDGLRRS